MGSPVVTQSVIDLVNGASDWQSYYRAYTDLYRDLVERRWGLGRSTFGNQLHHTAIPDASGTVAGTVTWAAYSQPSPETLLASLRVFGELASAEPQRRLANRYLFLILDGEPVTREAAAAAIGELAPQLDFWTGCIASLLDEAVATGPLRSADALFSVGDQDFGGRNLAGDATDAHALAEWLAVCAMSSKSEASTTRRHLRGWLIKSSVLLASFRLGITPQIALDLVNDQSGVPVVFARQRAQESGWGAEVDRYCVELSGLMPLHGEEYHVGPGDTLSRIARERYEMPFHVVWPIIKALNPAIVNPNLILAGQTIVLPSGELLT